MKDSEEVQRLVRLKRYETPGEEYFSSFADEFKDRQRSEMLSRSSRSLLAERVTVWFDGLHGAKWLVPAGAAAAAIGVGIFVSSDKVESEGSPQSALVGHVTAVNEVSENDPAQLAEENIHIKLPKPDQRVPNLKSSFPGNGFGLLPASSRGNLREL
tara:strand:- start:1506 stop:1976 length:471 start_codon:yes stop_codon:yes gene_type:complete